MEASGDQDIPFIHWSRSNDRSFPINFYKLTSTVRLVLPFSTLVQTKRLILQNCLLRFTLSCDLPIKRINRPFYIIRIVYNSICTICVYWCCSFCMCTPNGCRKSQREREFIFYPDKTCWKFVSFGVCIRYVFLALSSSAICYQFRPHTFQKILHFYIPG